MHKLKVKIITGFRRDQEYSIDADESHKAYHLFLNPDTRTIFSNGLAIRGEQIQEIVPDYQGTMGWNPSHVLGDDDWNELHGKGVMAGMQNLLNAAKEIALIAPPEDIQRPLSELIEQKYPQLASPIQRSGEAKSMKDLLVSKR